MQHWLLKTEPEDWSWNHQINSGDQGAEWNGVRNFQANKNFFCVVKLLSKPLIFFVNLLKRLKLILCVMSTFPISFKMLANL